MPHDCPPHRYRLPEPDGRSELPGICKYCGHVKYFRTAFPDEDISRLQNRVQHHAEKAEPQTPEERKAIKEDKLVRQREYGKAWREKKKKKKECVTCSSPVGPRSKVYCDHHHELRLKSYRRRYREQKKAKKKAKRPA